MKSVLLLAPLLAAAPGVLSAHEAGEGCCIFHEARSTYRESPRAAGGAVALDSPAAIPCWGLAALRPHAPLEPFHFARAPLGDYDLLIDILYAGICHSDIHAIDGEFSAPDDLSHFPYVAGHEIVGRVRSTGGKVTRHTVGDIVAAGCYMGSCGQCEHCQNGEEQYCRDYSLTYDFGGGLSTNIVVPEERAFRLPEGMDPARAAPLMCAGVTTYSAIKSADIKPGQYCAVAGFGGLGDVAAKILKSKGASVTVFDTNTAKADAAREQGYEFVDVTDAEAMRAQQMKFDFIVSTIPNDFDLMSYIHMLRVHGKLHCLGVPRVQQQIIVPYMIFANRTLTGSVVGSLAEHDETLRYCAEHGIYPDVELIDASRVNEAIEKLRSSTGGFRYVVDMQAFAESQAAAQQ